MKVTNLGNSKRLKELGFEAETNFCFRPYDKNKYQKAIYCTDRDLMKCKDVYAAYDLETILDALPKTYIDEGADEIYQHGFLIINIEYGEIGFCVDSEDMEMSILLACTKNEGESLTDCAARLLINLIEDKIIKL
jgi:hypothetical protein